jgi:hypothetical protein
MSISINVTVANGVYNFDGVTGPITIIRGYTYIFNVNTTGHPFWIQNTSSSYSAQYIYSDGVSNNGSSSGTITWIVSINAPNTLYYQCEYHSGMLGTINVISQTNVVCFEENSKILCFDNETSKEKYIKIKDLRKGNLVKTLCHGYIPIDIIGRRIIYHEAIQERIKNQLYKYSNDKYPEIFEDLLITGCHCILVKHFVSDEEKCKTIEVNGDIYITDNHYRLPTCINEKSNIHDKPGVYNIYHLALENDDYYMNYGIYANGLLVETCSAKNLKEISEMELIE